MKRLAVLLCSVLLTLCMASPTAAYYEPDVDYMKLMINAACIGDMEGGMLAQVCRDEKLIDTGLEYEHVDFCDMFLLAKAIEAEAGSCWISEEWKMAVGEVVLNRVDSPEFPDTLEDVISQPGQYSFYGTDFFDELLPSAQSADVASRLLEGERVLNEPSVVFQANFVLGGEVFMELHDELLGDTYLCCSSYPELYE